ncbi:MAG: NUDIX domain-containing protein [Candidatus Aenigmarchaeota archaeon]|nr:NUDIX domain-containing protein [Candidatus Aenigmarchaeota archaeon]
MTEYFDVVDEGNSVIGRAAREECHSKGLWHRASHVIIVNSKGELLLQKRSMKKDLYKGYWIDAAAGHVDSGEAYEHAAKRELKEEIGVTAALMQLFDFKKQTGNDNEIIRVFAARHDGPFFPNKEEVDFVKFFTLEEINEMLKKDKFTPATLDILKEINRDPSILSRF